MSEVSKHNKKTDAWIVIESRAYDITKYIPLHPGGWLPLENMAGKGETEGWSEGRQEQSDSSIPIYHYN